MVDINFIEIAQVCSGAFREAKQRKDDFFRIKWLKHNANCGKHLRFTPKTLSDDASYFLASKCLGSISSMGFKVSHLQIRD